MNELAVFPVEASTRAPGVDHLFFALVGLSSFIVILVTGLIVAFAVRYRRGHDASRGELPEVVSREFEIGWTAAAFFLAVFIFWWASSSQLAAVTPPPNALEIHIVAKQWMWKAQHPSGVREIDAVHAPVGRPVKLVMTSQDVIHSFFVPAFRMKQDVLPGRYTETWFQATRTGTFPLYCAEYCGTDHAKMLGRIVVQTPEQYGAWTAAQPQPDDLAGQGGGLYRSLGCSGCHEPRGAAVPAPDLYGLYGAPVKLADGRTIVADENYLRDSLVLPEREVAAGYQNVMPSYAKSVDEEGLVALVAYMKTLNVRPHGGAAGGQGGARR